MPRISSKSQDEFAINRVAQITDTHCGPAVLQMLLSNIGIFVTQEDIVQAAGITETIKEHGTRIDQMVAAVKRLAPQARFWYKEEARMKDVRRLLNEFHLPVGVEWQGVFNVGESDDDADGDEGHYSIITHVDEERREIIIVDPYKSFALQDRIFDIDEFVERWWDTNEIIDNVSGRERLVKDTRMLFVVAPREEYFAPDLHLRFDISHLLSRYHHPS